MQEFAAVLVERYQPPDVDKDKSHDIARLRAVVTHRAGHMATALRPFLYSLISYWGALHDLVQRQEHSGQKEGQPLTSEDARRVVFHTAIIFLEIDKALSTSA